MPTSQDASSPVEHTLTLPDDFQLTYTLTGSRTNPLLLFVIGSSGLGALYRRLAQELSAHFLCAYYNKRGFLARDTSPSVASSQTNPLVLAPQHADDAAALLQHLSPDSPAFVFGTSTGGTAVLDLAARYPSLVRAAVLHEPITFSVVARDLGNEMVGVYKDVALTKDPFEGFALFADYMFTPRREGAGPQGKPDNFLTERPKDAGPVEVYNSRQGQREAVAMVEYAVDVEAVRAVRDKLVLVAGMDSADLPVSEPGRALARVLGSGQKVWELAGGHMSFADKSHASDFCKQLMFVLHQEGWVAMQEGGGGAAKSKTSKI